MKVNPFILGIVVAVLALVAVAVVGRVSGGPAQAETVITPQWDFKSVG